MRWLIRARGLVAYLSGAVRCEVLVQRGLALEQADLGLRRSELGLNRSQRVLVRLRGGEVREAGEPRLRELHAPGLRVVSGLLRLRLAALPA
jgi:hypothetical protein